MAFPLFIVCCCDGPIEDYVPLNPDEKEIVTVLAQYQDAKTRHG
jgi:hypothetical protein